MLKTIYKIIIGVIVALGVLHILITFPTYGNLSVEAVWFASAGVAVISAGFLNIVLLRDTAKDRVVRTLCIMTNLILVLLFILLLLIFPAPHIFLGAGLFIAATLFSSGRLKI